MKQLARIGNPDTHSPKRLTRWQRRFISALRESPHVGLACKSVGISRETAYVHRRNNPLFAEQWQDALESAVDDLEVVAFREAMRGNTRLTIFLLKSHRKAVYSDIQRHEHLVAGRIILLPEKEEREP
jgi:hypothetical protein